MPACSTCSSTAVPRRRSARSVRCVATSRSTPSACAPGRRGPPDAAGVAAPAGVTDPQQDLDSPRGPAHFLGAFPVRGAIMSVRPYRDIQRRKSRQIMVGSVPVGGDAPITVQSMTNTPTPDAQATIEQIRRLEEVGIDIVRVSCPDAESTAALAAITRAVKGPAVAA